MKQTFLLILLIITGFATKAATDIDQVPNVHLSDRTRYVSNPDGILSQACVDSLDAVIGATWASTTAEPVVVALRDIPQTYEPIQFAVELGEKWGVGKADKDNGIILLLITDRRQMTIAPGRGAEGVLPDALCNRIIRDFAKPYFIKGDYDGGMLAATPAVCDVLRDPSNTGEILSRQANDAGADEESFDIVQMMLWFGIISGSIMLLLIIWTYFSTRKSNDVIRYERLNTFKPVSLFLSFMGLGIPLPAFLLCIMLMNHVRNRKRLCPNCSHQMQKLDEETDNKYLTPAQDREEQLNSVDYDVWLCPDCGEMDVIPYINKSSALSECPHCHARANQPVGTRTVIAPTTSREGRGENTYVCRNCGQTTRVPYRIAKLAAPVVIIGPGGGGGFGGGGGGISGGSFGGGSFGGGGATGSW